MQKAAWKTSKRLFHKTELLLKLLTLLHYALFLNLNGFFTDTLSEVKKLRAWHADTLAVYFDFVDVG